MTLCVSQRREGLPSQMRLCCSYFENRPENPSSVKQNSWKCRCGHWPGAGLQLTGPRSRTSSRLMFGPKSMPHGSRLVVESRDLANAAPPEAGGDRRAQMPQMNFGPAKKLARNWHPAGNCASILRTSSKGGDTRATNPSAGRLRLRCWRPSDLANRRGLAPEAQGLRGLGLPTANESCRSFSS
jgi:hypothetical protein